VDLLILEEYLNEPNAKAWRFGSIRYGKRKDDSKTLVSLPNCLT